MDFTVGDILHGLLASLRWTAALSCVAFICGGALGLAVMWLRLSPARGMRGAAAAFIELFQGTPLLMQLFIVFFALRCSASTCLPGSRRAPRCHCGRRRFSLKSGAAVSKPYRADSGSRRRRLP
jgi:His/Glu/Gln/Arg/opine family amino acid ABC transporter permease subunit